MADPRVVIVGATGAVGKVLLQVLEERDFPMQSLRLCASPRSQGKKVLFRGKEIVIEEANAKLFSECDIAFVAAGGSTSRALDPIAAANGCTVVDKSSAWRMDPTVPLVVPEINGADVEWHRGIVSVPNCSTTQMVMALWPLHRVNPIKRVVVDTYQAVSGTGAAAVDELEEQTRQIVEGRPLTREVYPHQIAFNALPQVETFTENGYTTEEMKIFRETRKIFHDESIKVSATAVRVPVTVSHSEALHVEFERPMPVDEARRLLSAFPGVTVVDDPASSAYPLALDAAGKDDVFVGRIRQDISAPNSLAMWVVSDNLRKGAATNGVQIAEELLKRKALLRHRATAAG
ncbi:MAG: aspartate-semialdehyde dehydrogenase [SAR202 cluster bacterium]|nr:aspartate-semialdehyde dehydrogenase [SAR202 cluster bacterium]